jgi:hypothetical protein
MTVLRRIPKYAEWCRRQNHDLSYHLLQCAQMMIGTLIGATSDEKDFTLSRANLSLWEAQAANDEGPSFEALRTNFVSSSSTTPSSPLSSDQVITETEFLRQVKEERLTIGAFHVWKARICFIHGHLDMAWESIEKALLVRPYLSNLLYESDLVFHCAMIALSLIGRHEVG